MRLHRALAAATLVLGLAAVGAGYAASSAANAQGGTLPSQIRAATARYHDLGAAQRAGWNTLFQDVNGVTCIEDTETPSMGGMGFHWVNGANVGSTDPAQPAALIYAPGPSGHLRLAGMEYLVPDVPTGTVPQP